MADPRAHSEAAGELDEAGIRRTAYARAEGLAEAELTHPFGEDTDVFKVRGKIFMVGADVHGRFLLTLKCDPEESPVLQRAYPSVVPGWHMNKRHWISVSPGPGVDRGLVEELVEDAYRRIGLSLPRGNRPADVVDPQA